MLVVTALLLPGVKKYTPSFSMKSSIPDGLKILSVSGIVWLTAALIKTTLQGDIYLQFLIMGTYIVLTYAALIMLLRVKCINRIIERFKGVR